MIKRSVLNDVKDIKKTERIYIIDYLKGVSIFTIVLMHLIQNYTIGIPNIINKMASIGGSGVHIFFVCSGFGLYFSYLHKPYSFVSHIKKRFIKVYLPYVIVVIISFVLPWILCLEDRVVALLSHVFLFKMFVEKYECSFGGHFWFISTIIQFYLLFIFLCKIKDKLVSSAKFLMICSSISFIWWFFIYVAGLENVRIWSSCFLQYLWEFALGMCLAEYVKTGKKISINKLVLFVCAILGIGIQAVMALLGNGLEVFNDVPALIGYGSLVMLLYNIHIVKIVGIYLSKISYEWYLVHILTFSSVFHFCNVESLWEQVVISILAFIGSICLAYLYYYFLKRISYLLSLVSLRNF